MSGERRGGTSSRLRRLTPGFPRSPEPLSEIMRGGALFRRVDVDDLPGSHAAKEGDID